MKYLGRIFDRETLHFEYEPCPACGQSLKESGHLVRFEDTLSCSRYPNCQYVVIKQNAVFLDDPGQLEEALYSYRHKREIEFIEEENKILMEEFGLTDVEVEVVTVLLEAGYDKEEAVDLVIAQRNSQ